MGGVGSNGGEAAAALLRFRHLSYRRQIGRGLVNNGVVLVVGETGVVVGELGVEVVEEGVVGDWVVMVEVIGVGFGVEGEAGVLGW